MVSQKRETIARFRSALSVRLNGFRRASCHQENCQENKSNEKDLERTENLHVSPVGDITTGNTGYVDSTVNLPTQNPYWCQTERLTDISNCVNDAKRPCSMLQIYRFLFR